MSGRAGINYEGYWQNDKKHGNGTYTYSDGYIYSGEYYYEKRQGHGIYIWANGDKFEGGWQNNKRHEEGVYIFANRDTKIGRWQNGTFQTTLTGCVFGDCTNGYGAYAWSSGEVYIGNWSSFQRNGEGVNYFSDKTVYSGEWKDDKRQGYGIQSYTDGTTKTGNWDMDTFVGSNKHDIVQTGCISGNCETGYGTYVWESGEKYIGYWINDKRNGQGTNFFTDGGQYVGEWKDNKRDGYGTNIYADETSKTGYWEDDKYIGSSKTITGCISGNCNNGYGIYVFENGNKYEGNWQNGQYNGQGTFEFSDGRKYIGKFENDAYNGFGIFYFSDETKQEGNWKDNVFIGTGGLTGCVSGDCNNGYGTCIFSNGDKYIGSFQNNSYSGQGTYYFTNSGNKYEGEWADGKYNGRGKLYYADGTYKSGLWKDNVFVGHDYGDAPSITWLSPEFTNTQSTSATITIKLRVQSDSEIKNVQVYVNDNLQVRDTRGFKVVSTTCDYTVERSISLSLGDNKVKVIVENEAGSTTSDTKTIAYAGSETSANKLALVIGNATYTDAPLRNPENDANSIADELRTLGFEVMLYTNIGQNDMKRYIREFGEKLTANKGIGLFYFAGHGIQLNGENYLVPVNVPIEKEQDVEIESIRLQRVLGEMEYAGNDMNIVILDACRNNPFVRSFRSGGSNGLATTNAPKGTFIAFATAPGSVAEDGTGNNGLYTEELLKAIKIPGLRIEDVFKRVRVNVYQRSSRKQVPWENASIFGDFYFKK